MRDCIFAQIHSIQTPTAVEVQEVLFLTPNCQSDPEWNPKVKLGTQDILDVEISILKFLTISDGMNF